MDIFRIAGVMEHESRRNCPDGLLLMSYDLRRENEEVPVIARPFIGESSRSSGMVISGFSSGYGL